MPLDFNRSVPERTVGRARRPGETPVERHEWPRRHIKDGLRFIGGPWVETDGKERYQINKYKREYAEADERRYLRDAPIYRAEKENRQENKPLLDEEQVKYVVDEVMHGADTSLYPGNDVRFSAHHDREIMAYKLSMSRGRAYASTRLMDDSLVDADSLPERLRWAIDHMSREIIRLEDEHAKELRGGMP